MEEMPQLQIAHVWIKLIRESEREREREKERVSCNFLEATLSRKALSQIEAAVHMNNRFEQLGLKACSDLPLECWEHWGANRSIIPQAVLRLVKCIYSILVYNLPCPKSA